MRDDSEPESDDSDALPAGVQLELTSCLDSRYSVTLSVHAQSLEHAREIVTQDERCHVISVVQGLPGSRGSNSEDDVNRVQARRDRASEDVAAVQSRVRFNQFDLTGKGYLEGVLVLWRSELDDRCCRPRSHCTGEMGMGDTLW